MKFDLNYMSEFEEFDDGEVEGFEEAVFSSDEDSDVDVDDDNIDDIVSHADTVTTRSHVESDPKCIPIIPLTKYEKARIIGDRAGMLASGAPPYVNVEGMTSEIDIAMKEYNEGKLPYNIHRPMPNGKVVIQKMTDIQLKY